jgi:hypothetical protein
VETERREIIMYKRYLAVTVALAGLWAVLAPSAEATPKGGCALVAAADRDMCQRVRAQHAYGWTDERGNPENWTPNGKAVVWEITHQGYTKSEMRDALKGAARNYRDYVTQIKIDADMIMELCGSDGLGAVSFVDEDGKPGGRKYVWKHIICA